MSNEYRCIIDRFVGSEERSERETSEAVSFVTVFSVYNCNGKNLRFFGNNFWLYFLRLIGCLRLCADAGNSV